MLGWDVRLQIRYGFYAVYAILTVGFILGLRVLGPGLRTDAAVLLIVTDPTVLGFYFIASLVLFEKGEGVLDALVVSPLGVRGYLASKVLSLALLATTSGTLAAVLGHGAVSNLPVLVVGILLSAALFVLIGFVAVARFDSINAYFISAAGWGTVLFLPLFEYVGFVETPLFYLLPAKPAIVLVHAGFSPIAAWELAYALGYLLLGNVVAYVWASRAFRRHIVSGGDPGAQLGHHRQTNQPRGAVSAARLPVVALIRTDVRNWLRDPMLAFVAVAPLLLSSIIRVGMPTVTQMAAPAVALEPYYPVIAGTMAVFGPAIYGFVAGMFVLEDREQGVLAAYRTSPLSARGYLLYRAGTAYALSLGATLPALVVVGLVPAPPLVVLGVAAVAALGGPVLAFTFGSLASNTIEGIAISKLLNPVLLGPALIIALVPEPLQLLAGVSPTYWPVKAYVAGVSDDPLWVGYVLVGIVVHLLFLLVFARLFQNRTE